VAEEPQQVVQQAVKRRLIAEALSSDGLQWTIAENALRLISDQQAVRRAICEALDRSTSDIATRRLDRYLSAAAW
jgi:hypothetical protein